MDAMMLRRNQIKQHVKQNSTEMKFTMQVRCQFEQKFPDHFFFLKITFNQLEM